MYPGYREAFADGREQGQRDMQAENERLRELLCSLIWLPKVREAIAELSEDDRLRAFAKTV